MDAVENVPVLLESEFLKFPNNDPASEHVKVPLDQRTGVLAQFVKRILAEPTKFKAHPALTLGADDSFFMINRIADGSKFITVIKNGVTYDVYAFSTFFKTSQLLNWANDGVFFDLGEHGVDFLIPKTVDGKPERTMSIRYVGLDMFTANLLHRSTIKLVLKQSDVRPELVSDVYVVINDKIDATPTEATEYMAHYAGSIARVSHRFEELHQRLKHAFLKEVVTQDIKMDDPNGPVTIVTNYDSIVDAPAVDEAQISEIADNEPTSQQDAMHD